MPGVVGRRGSSGCRGEEVVARPQHAWHMCSTELRFPDPCVHGHLARILNKIAASRWGGLCSDDWRWSPLNRTLQQVPGITT